MNKRGMNTIYREGKAALLNIENAMRMKSNAGEECGNLRTRKGVDRV